MSSVLMVSADNGRTTYAAFLRAQGLTVNKTASPQDAQQLLADGMLPDVIIADSLFPGSEIGPAEFVRDLRFRLDEAVSIVVTCGLAGPENPDLFRLAGADFLL